MDIINIFRKINYTPKRTIRVVLFMNEENGLRGGNAYAESTMSSNEKHIFALESDAGGFTPRGFSFDCSEEEFEQVLSWKKLFKPYLIHYFEIGGSGADIRPLKNKYNVLSGLRPAAIKPATVSKRLLFNSSGFWNTVIACRSTTQYMHSISF